MNSTQQPAGSGQQPTNSGGNLSSAVCRLPSGLRIERLNFSVGNFALQDLSLEVRTGEYFVLLGPSGSGKTLLLECLCGLNRIHSGRIVIGGVDVTHLEPRRRGIGYLPQDYALFPNKTVRGNVRFGLIAAGQFCGESEDQLMELTGVAHLADRLPGNLSGGEKQRVALARALAIHPKLLLLDEPVSALDEQMRDKLCWQLRQLQRQTQTTTLHVCHNFAEMLAVADRVAIIHAGRILQVDTPRAVLERPRNRFVAQFVQAGNLFAARACTDGQWLRLACSDGIEFRALRPLRPVVCADAIPRNREEDFQEQVEFVVRPENVHLASDRFQDMPPGTTILEAVVLQVVDLGPLVQLTVACGSQSQLLVSLGKKQYNMSHFSTGDRVHLAIAPQDVHVLEK